MIKTISPSQFGSALILGSVWGLSEAALGMGLRACAALVSGSLMTGVALFFLAAGWVVTRRILPVALLVIMASLFKLFDALLLSLPVRHGAIINPIFAFFLEGAAFVFIAASIKDTLKRRRTHQAILGGVSALTAVMLFPLVKFVTNIPACVFPGTAVPLSIFLAPLAVAVSCFTVPLGFLAGERFISTVSEFERSDHKKSLRYFISPAALLTCLAIVAMIRKM